jgi:hypothetical protein
MTELTVTEKYLLAQILALGDVSHHELCEVNEMLYLVRKRALDTLEDNGYLEHTLYNE